MAARPVTRLFGLYAECPANLLFVFREVTANDAKIELAEDRFLRLSFQQKLKRFGDKLLDRNLLPHQVIAIGCFHRHDVLSAAATIDNRHPILPRIALFIFFNCDLMCHMMRTETPV